MSLYNFTQAQESVRGYTRRFERRREIIQALLGDGAGNIEVSGDPGWVWVRVEGDPDGVAEAKNRASSLPLVEGIVVDLQRVWPTGLGYYEVLGLSSTVLYETTTVGPGSGADGSGYAAVIAAHAAQHVTGDRGASGFDPLTVNVRALAPLRARAQTTPNMTVVVDGGYYFINSFKLWTAANSGAFTAPIGPGSAQYDLLYLGADDALHIVAGTPVISATPTFPAIPANSLPICFVYLTSTTTGITEAEITDARVVLTASVPALTPTTAVTSIAKSGEAALVGDVTLSEGAGIALTQVAQDIEVANDGVLSLAKNGEAALVGDVTLSEGANITLTQVGQDIEIASSGGGAALTVMEQDGVPSVANVIEIKVPNGSLTDNGGGSVSLAYATHDHVFQEDLSADCDGGTTTFTLANAYAAGTTIVSLNGVVQLPGAGNSYTEDGPGYTTITFDIAPLSGDELLVDYLKAGGGGGGGGGAVDALGLATYQTKTATVENQTVAGSATQTIIHLTAQSGTMLAMFLAISGASVYVDGVINIYIDGEGSPSITFDLGTLGNHYNNNDGYFSTKHIGIERSGTEAGYVFKFPVYFATELQVDFYNPTGTSAQIWSVIQYTNDETSTRRLKSAGLTYLNKATVTSAATYDFLSLAAGNAGWIVWHSLVGAGASNFTYLERNVDAYVDGEVTASYQTTGTEDYFTGAFYYVAGRGSFPWAFVTRQDAKISVQAVDLLELMGGIKYTDGVVLRWQTEGGVTTDADISYLVLYYEA